MGRTITISTNKGGVLKTSLTTNIAGVLAQSEELREAILKAREDYKKAGSRFTKRLVQAILNLKGEGKKVLIIDTDSQANVAISFGINDPEAYENSLYDVLLKGTDIKKAIIPVHKNIDLLLSNLSMIRFEFSVLTNVKEYPDFFHIIKEKIDPIKDQYDYIIIDTPPSLGLTAGNALIASDEILIPFQPESYSMRALVTIIHAINDFTQNHNPDLEILGVVATLVDSRTVLHSEILSQCRKFGLDNDIKVFDTVIPRSVRFATSVAHKGRPATLTNIDDPLVQSYYELVKEMGL